MGATGNRMTRNEDIRDAASDADGRADTKHAAVNRPVIEPNANPDDQTDDPADEQFEEQMSSAASSDLQFACVNCGANMRWDPDEDALHCRYCQHTVPVPRAEGTILERPLAEAGTAARGLGLDRRVVRCDTCGATVSLDTNATTEFCTFCGSSSVLDQAENRNAIRPESLIPIDVGRSDVESAFKKWLGGLWFRPNALKALRKFEAAGVYAPFWTFDCSVFSEWSADAGYYYYVTQTYTVMVNGKPQMRTRQVRKVRWVPKWGDRSDAYDDVLVHASIGRPCDLVTALGPFDLGALVPYRPEYLAGWRAEEYQVDLEHGWSRGQMIVEAEQKRRCSGDVPGDTQRRLKVANTISGVHWKHILLPIWSLQYRFKDKTYTVLIHGQTGRVVGRAPYSWIKITAAVLGGLAAVGGTMGIIAMNGGL